MFGTYEHLAAARHHELVRDAQRARLARCAQPPRPWRRRTRRPCV